MSPASGVVRGIKIVITDGHQVAVSCPPTK